MLRRDGGHERRFSMGDAENDDLYTAARLEVEQQTDLMRENAFVFSASVHWSSAPEA